MSEFNVAKLAEDLGVEPHIVRTKLRAAQVEKTEGQYAWKTKGEYAEVLKKLKGGGKAEVKDEPKGKTKTKSAGAAPENKSGKGKKKAPKED